MTEDFKQQLNGLNTRELHSCFAKACGNGEAALVSHMLDNADINNLLKDAYHNLGFSLACLNGELEIVKNMINNYDKLNIQKASGFNGVPVKNADEVINFLLNDEKYPLDFSAVLQQAISYGRVRVAKLILTNKKIIEENKNNKENNVITIDGNLVSLDSLLIYACEHNHVDMAKFVLSDKDLTKHANIHAENDISLNIACHNGNLELVKLLLAEGADIHNQEDSPLLNACKSRTSTLHEKMMDIIKYLTTSPELKEHANIHAQDGYALILAFENDDDELVKFLLTDPNLNNKIDIFNHISELKEAHFQLWNDNGCESEKDLENDKADDYNNDGVYNAKVLKYLLNEYKLVSDDSAINSTMDEILEELPILQKINQHNRLNKTLEINPSTNKTPKI